ncbi:thiamine phosphate synthase [Clostridium sp. LY3-2]|uniref:thiamine phosphate synthase n=1 Tax=Clostridium sp. LY3-2 TaxID=2942482 RepID=UPI002152C1E7|nr:thiamine phosphate synthase [Clostridium sp. LY3-2]MCR6513954.1 thiamine phosphate synthase [Clostridium sp. LY3-2]
MKNFKDKKIYLVTDHRLEFDSLLKKVREALEAGVSLVQYRDKDVSTKVMVERGRKLKDLCDEFNSILLVNDRIDVALAIDAGGVHVGQDDMDSKDARKILGLEKIIGVSTKTLEESIKALESGADYLGCGAIYSTSTKDTSVISIETLKEIRNKVKIPVYGIGGIKLDNITPDLKENVDGVAVITDILDSEDIKETVNKFSEKLM